MRKLAFLDLDGVLSNDTNRVKYALERRWVEYFSKIPEDTVLLRGKELYYACFMCDYEVRYLTGRREDTREATTRWLKKHGFDHKLPLVMRNYSDRRPLAELKTAVVTEALREYDIVVLYDDDPLVVEECRKVNGDSSAVLCTWYKKHPRLVSKDKNVKTEGEKRNDTAHSTRTDRASRKHTSTSRPFLFPYSIFSASSSARIWSPS